MSFVVEISRALAWPFVVLVLGFRFRAELRELLSRITSLKLPWAEFSTISADAVKERQLQEARAALSSPEPTDRPVRPTPTDEQILTKVAEAKKSVLSLLEHEIGLPFQRQVAYNHRPDIVFDGAAFDRANGLLVVAESRLVLSPSEAPNIVRDFLYRVAQLPPYPKRAILVLVVEEEGEVERVRRQAMSGKGQIQMVDLRVYALGQLMQTLAKKETNA